MTRANPGRETTQPRTQIQLRYLQTLAKSTNRTEHIYNTENLQSCAMGRRAKKAPVQTKKRPTLAKRFKCPFCANEETVECKMDFRVGIGSLACRLCGASYQMPIHHLHEPVDVFSEWLDDCEAAAQGKRTGGGRGGGAPGPQDLGTSSAMPQYDSEDDDDDDVPNPSGLGKTNKAKASSKAAAAPAQEQRRSYNDLGLGDSDDDDDGDSD